MDQADKKEIRSTGPVWSRSEFLFILTALTVLAGLLIPWPGRFLDAMWIICLCLTVSVLLICRSAASSSQLDGFPALTAGAGLLAILLTAGCIKWVILQRSSGLVVLKVGTLVAASGTAAAPILLILAGIVLTFAVCYSAFRIRRAIEEYLFKVLPFKRAGLETDRTLHVLTEEKARAIEEKIRREAGFFASMGGIGFLFNGLMICSILFVGGAFLLVWLMDTMAASDSAARPDLAQAIIPIAGTAVLSWLSLASILPACAALLSKKYFALAPETEQDLSSRKVVVVSPETGRTEEVELLNPDFITLSKSAAPVSPNEQIAEFEPETQGYSTLRRIEIRSRDVQAYYRTLGRLIRHPELRRKIVLLASETRSDLPVTVAVHTAVLTAEQEKVLLIDADLQRQAVAQVFELKPDKEMEKIRKTRIPGLSILVPRTSEEDRLHFLDSLDRSAKDFSQILIYAPEFDIRTLSPQYLLRPMLALYFTQADSTDLPAQTSQEPEGFIGLSVWPVGKAVSDSPL